MGAEGGNLEEKRVARVLELQSIGLVAKVLELPATMVPKAMVVKKFPRVVVVTVELAVLLKVPTVVILIKREAPEVVVKGARVEKDNRIVVEGEAVILAVKVAAKEAEVLDMDLRVL